MPIDNQTPATGRYYEEDGSVVNIADVLGSANEIVTTVTVTGASPQTVDIPLPAVLQPNGQYVVSINNTGLAGVTVSVQSKETFGATEVYGELTSFTVAAGSAKITPVQGWLIGEAGRLALTSSSDIALTLRIRKV